MSELAADPDHEVRIAAVEALANHGDPASDSVIVAAAKVGDAPLCSQDLGRIAKARVRYAAGLARGEKVAEARKVYEAILSSDPPAAQAAAAKRALESIG